MMHGKLVAGIKVDGKVMREFNDKIFIPFGTDYSIFLINLNSQKVQVNIQVDGEDILDGQSLLINSNDKLDLERWLVGGNNKGPKLKFVEKTDEIRETKPETGLDGIVKISYQFEKVYDWSTPIFNGSFRYYQPAHYYSHSDYSTSSDLVGEPRAVSNCVDPNQVVYSSSVQNEDGFTVKGEDSDQKFQEGYIGSVEQEVHTICFHLKGGVLSTKVKKPVTVKTKITCDACYKKMKSSYKFCTQCGNNLNYSK